MTTTTQSTLPTFTLTEAQRKAFDAVEGTNDNYFIGGKPGVGKSVLVRALRNEGEKFYHIAAPTGLAAINAGGKTLHSLFGLPISEGIIPPDFMNFSRNDNVLNHAQYSIKHLIIDEISMVRCDALDFIDRFLRKVKGVDAPFGGVQVIVVGDFFQLPPVVKGLEKKDLQAEGWRSEFAFDSKVFDTFKYVELTEVLRQKGDTGFVKLLQNARTGDLTLKQAADLNDRVDPDFEDVRIRLVGTNAMAEEVNSRELSKLPEPTVEFSATSFGDWGRDFPAEPLLRLRVGAQVMVKLNGADKPNSGDGKKQESRVVNGTLGVVEEIFREEKRVVINVDGASISIYWKRFERKLKEKVDGQWTERVIASFEQIPLALAWAISMHKSQGQSFDRVHIDAKKIFAAGQLYVALSRCRSLEGVTLESRINKDKFYANPRVVEYYKNLKSII